MKILKRDEQKIENTWRLEDIYEKESLFEDEFKEVESLIESFKSFEGTLSQDGKLYEMLKSLERINYLFERLYVYANQRSHQDTANAKYQQMAGKCDILAVNYSVASSFMEPEILSLDDAFLKAQMSQPEMSGYARMLEMITNNKEHILDAKTEGLLSKVSELGQIPDNVYSMFNNADIKFNDVLDQDGNAHPLTQGTYIRCLENADRVLRENAFNELYRVYGQFNNTLAAVYYGNLKSSDFFAKQRKYTNTLEAKLSSNEIPLDVYDTLIESVHDHMDAMYKYVTLRKKALGYEDLHMYDNYASLCTLPEKKYSFEEAKQLCLEGLAPLGEDYLDILRTGFNNRWIDVYENEGKRTGAYSWGCYGTHPYVLLNYHESLNDVFTLAHEMGHSIHTYYSNKNQNIFNAEYKIFVAEVASTCNEALLIHYLMNKTTDHKEKLYLINYFLDQFKGTMYRQTMFGEFEKQTHDLVNKGEVLTGQTLNDIYYKLNQLYFGEEMNVDEAIKYEWSRIPHFYTPFYVYQYATSFAAAIAISTKILNGEEGIVEKYKQFLSGGCSMTPIDLLKICDVDMSKKEPIDAALDVFKEYVDELEKML